MSDGIKHEWSCNIWQFTALIFQVTAQLELIYASANANVNLCSVLLQVEPWSQTHHSDCSREFSIKWKLNLKTKSVMKLKRWPLKSQTAESRSWSLWRWLSSHLAVRQIRLCDWLNKSFSLLPHRWVEVFFRKFVKQSKQLCHQIVIYLTVHFWSDCKVNNQI